MFILLLGALRCLFLMLKLNAFKVDQCTLISATVLFHKDAFTDSPIFL